MILQAIFYLNSIAGIMKMPFFQKIRNMAASAGLTGQSGWLFPVLLLLTGIFLASLLVSSADETYAPTHSHASAISFANDLDDQAPATRMRNGATLLQRVLSRGNAPRNHYFELKPTPAILCSANQLSAGSTGAGTHLLNPCRDLMLLHFLKSAVPARAAPQVV
jgi:hypothetical protein